MEGGAREAEAEGHDRLKGRKKEEVEALKDFIAKEERRVASRKAHAEFLQKKRAASKRGGGDEDLFE